MTDLKQYGYTETEIPTDGLIPGRVTELRREQLVAVNFDFVFILSSLNRDFNVNRILRYLTQARQSGGQPVVILTKADLVLAR